MEQDKKDPELYPALRKDLKITRQSFGGEIGFIVKDPLKNSYFRFSFAEWQIISLFDGSATLEEFVEKYNESHHDSEIDVETLRAYQSNLQSLNLLQKSTQETNLMLIEKMKELRQSHLLSVKGSLFYKRFPLIDPDSLFKKILPHITFFWSRSFLLFAICIMFLGSGLILWNWAEFKNGVYQLATFQHTSALQLFILWVIVYVVIGIHELGHGLTCRYYGGEVHEIGFLLLFFQPCLYCNVNDAWMLDKKWKQVAVTLAGGFIEYFIASLAAIGWALTAPGTGLNTLLFQIMSVGSISTILFNFNPLIKLDGYYLLADFLGAPNLRDRSFGFLKYWVSSNIFGIPSNSQEEMQKLTRKEKIIFGLYGSCAALWTSSTMLGLLYMIRNMAERFFPQITLLVTLLGIYKFFGAQIKKALFFLVQWILSLQSKSKNPVFQTRLRYTLGIVLLGLALPLPYTISGRCFLEPSFTRVIRSESHGRIEKFIKHDGEQVQYGDTLIKLENPIVQNNLKMAELDVSRLELQVRNALVQESPELQGVRRELATKKQDLENTQKRAESLKLQYFFDQPGLLSCPDEAKRVQSFVRKGEDLCKVFGVQELTLTIETPENQVRFLKPGDLANFRVLGNPISTHEGRVIHIRALPKPDPYHALARLYAVEMKIPNPHFALRPGQSGIAKIKTGWTPILIHLIRGISNLMNLDLLLI